MMLQALESQVHQLLSAVPLLHRAAALGYQAVCSLQPAGSELLEPVAERANCFFGFHDRSPWSAAGTELLAHSIPDRRYLNRGRMGVALLSHDLAVEEHVSCTLAWNWQQGACLTWLPDGHHFAFHDIDAGHPVTRFFTATGRPVGDVDGHWTAFSPNGKTAFGFCHGALARGMPGYGYGPLRRVAAVANGGIRTLDLATGRQDTLLSITRLRAAAGHAEDGWPFVTHAKLSPSGTRLFLLFRVSHSLRAMSTFAFTYDLGADRLQALEVDDCSHMAWVDDSSVMVTGRTGRGVAHQVLCACTGAVRSVSPLLHRDGHPWVLPDGRVVTDSYPDRQRMQTLFLADPVEGSVRTLLRYRVPIRFSGRFRCDLHPRVNRTSEQYCVDVVRHGRRTLLLGRLPGRPTRWSPVAER